MTTKRLFSLLFGPILLAACAKEPPPPSVTQFLEDSILLEATMIRCSQNRSETRYDAECINAREAVKRIEAREDAARRAELEKQSEAKRRALRRTQQAAAEARRRSEQRERERQEAEYLAQFGELPPQQASGEVGDASMSNLPGAIIPEAETTVDEPVYRADTLPPADGGNAPVVQTEPEVPEVAEVPEVSEASEASEASEKSEELEEPAPGDLGSIRDELRRRNEEGDDGN